MKNAASGTAPSTASRPPRVPRGRLALGVSLLLLLALSVIVLQQRRAIGGLGFVDDRAYLNLAVAAHLIEQGSYGAVGQRIPATTDVVWRFAVAGCDWLCNDLASAPYLVGALAALLALLATLALARRLDARPGFLALVALLMVFATSLSFDAVSGLSSALAALFAVSAFRAHARGLSPDGQPLPVAAAFCVGLAALLRIEFVALWLAFAVHALAMCFTRRGAERGFLFTLVRAVTGAVVVAIVLTPSILWNLQVIGVPWPRFAGAPLTLDAWAAGSSDPAAQTRMLMGDALRHGIGWLHEAPFLRAAIPRLFAWAGVVLLVVDAVRSRDKRPATALVAVVLVPVAFAPLYPYVGADAVPELVRSLQPLWVLAAAYAALRAADALRLAMDRLLPQVPEALRAAAPLVALAGLLVLSGMARNSRVARVTRAQLADSMAARERAMRALDAAPAAGAVASDRVGWMLYRKTGPVVDLTGEITPHVLGSLNADGSWDISRLGDFLRAQDARRMLLWEEGDATLASSLGCRTALGRPIEWPQVCAFSRNAVP